MSSPSFAILVFSKNREFFNIFSPKYTAADTFHFAADFNPSQRLFLFCRRNARTFIVRETVAYMQLPIKVSGKIIS